jgi:hypothetical protein
MYRIMNPPSKQTTPLEAKPYPKVYDEESSGTVQRIYIQYIKPTPSKKFKKV